MRTHVLMRTGCVQGRILRYFYFFDKCYKPHEINVFLLSSTTFFVLFTTTT